MKKKILLVITKSNFGGAQRAVYDLATHLDQEKCDVVVAFGHGEKGRAGRLSRILIDKKIRTIVIPELVRDMNFLVDFRALQTLIGMFRDETPDVVHLHSSKAGGLGALAARIARVPRIIFTAHGLPSDEARPLFQRLPIALFTWFTIMLSHHTIFVSRDTFNQALHFPFMSWKKSRLSLIFNGMEAAPLLTQEEARRELIARDPSLREGGSLVGTIAELHANKDIKTAIDAIALLPQAHLCVIGDGELREELAAYAQKSSAATRVHFLGYIENAARLLPAFDAFLLTSLKEGSPYVLLEAGLAKVPVVAVDIPGVRDCLSPDATGLLTTRSPKDIAAAIQRLLENDTLARALTEGLLKRVHEEYSLERMVAATTALYKA